MDCGRASLSANGARPQATGNAVPGWGPYLCTLCTLCALCLVDPQPSVPASGLGKVAPLQLSCAHPSAGGRAARHCLSAPSTVDEVMLALRAPFGA